MGSRIEIENILIDNLKKSIRNIDRVKIKPIKYNLALTIDDLQFRCLYTLPKLIYDRRMSFTSGIYCREIFLTGDIDPYILHLHKNLIRLQNLHNDNGSSYFYDKKNNIFLKLKNNFWSRADLPIITKLKYHNKKELKHFMINEI